MSLAFSYVLDLAEREMVKDKKFLSAITAYALALYNPTDAGTVLKIESLIGYIVGQLDSLSVMWMFQLVPDFLLLVCFCFVCVCV